MLLILQYKNISDMSQTTSISAYTGHGETTNTLDNATGLDETGDRNESLPPILERRQPRGHNRRSQGG